MAMPGMMTTIRGATGKAKATHGGHFVSKQSLHGFLANSDATTWAVGLREYGGRRRRRV